MASTADRLRAMVSSNLEVDGKPVNVGDDLNVGLTDLGVSSVDVVAFAKLANDEFDLSLTVEDCANIPTLQALVDRIDG